MAVKEDSPHQCYDGGEQRRGFFGAESGGNSRSGLLKNGTFRTCFTQRFWFLFVGIKNALNFDYIMLQLK